MSQGGILSYIAVGKGLRDCVCGNREGLYRPSSYTSSVGDSILRATKTLYCHERMLLTQNGAPQFIRKVGYEEGKENDFFFLFLDFFFTFSLIFWGGKRVRMTKRARWRRAYYLNAPPILVSWGFNPLDQIRDDRGKGEKMKGKGRRVAIFSFFWSVLLTCGACLPFCLWGRRWERDVSSTLRLSEGRAIFFDSFFLWTNCNVRYRCL